MNLSEFVDRYRKGISERVIESYPPLYSPAESTETLPALLRNPMGAQKHAILATALSLRQERGTTVVGEMGTGKTYIATAAAYAAGFQTVLVLCPPHLTRKWRREIEETVPSCTVAEVKTTGDLRKLSYQLRIGPLFVIMSRERAKLSYSWKPAVIYRWARSAGQLVKDDYTGEPYKLPHCASCNAQVVDKDGIPLLWKELNRKKHSCMNPMCREPLWTADNTGLRRYPLSDYVKSHMAGFFDLFIGDEIHEYKGRGSAQGIAAGVLADSCGKTLNLSGTLMGGYASTIFYLLYRFSPSIRTEFDHHDEKRWVNRYGFEEYTINKADYSNHEDGRASRRRSYKKVVRERPGMAPGALFHIIGNSVFLRLSDVASGLPDYNELVMLTSLDTEEDATGFSQASAYQELFKILRSLLTDALRKGSKRLLATYLQTLLAYPETCIRGETVFDPRDGKPIVAVPPLDEEKVYPKEQELLDIVAREKAQGRRVLVYATHTQSRDVTERIKTILEQHDHRATIMRSNAVPPERREAWVRDKVKDGIDVLICHPRLVQTGLDLIDFPTIVWYETEYLVLQST